MLFFVITLILAILFVLKILDPDKYEKAAKKIDYENRGSIKNFGNFDDFMKNWIELEFVIKDLIKHYEIQTRTRENGVYTLKDMINGLLEGNFITYDIYRKIDEINKYRNLVVHGNLQIDQK